MSSEKATPLAAAPDREFIPYVADSTTQAELTFRAVLLGSLLGIVFGAASVYLGLRVGLTTSASIPIAVMAITILKKLGNSTILENNIVQTTGSAGESIAAAVVFTIPALIFLGFPMKISITFLIALTGGVLGVLMMIPLRRYLIVKEHGTLRFPEGTACAEILIAGEKGGTSARKIFQGIGIGAGFKLATSLFGLFKARVGRGLAFFPGSQLECETSPELLAVGYIIGYQTSVIMVAGGLLAALILAPTIYFFGSKLSVPLAPATTLISGMDFGMLRDKYIRYIGAGAVAAGGVLGLVRAAPAIWDSLTASLKQLRQGAGSADSVKRTERDTPITWVLGGSLAIIIFIAIVPIFRMNLLGAALIVVFGFLFSVVSARITGLVGSSSCPLSGMTIAVVIGTCLIFLAVGWTGSSYSYLALVIGAIVCIAISNAGTTAQDLKTGHLVGATPFAQQTAILAGVLTSVVAVGWTTYALNVSETKTIALKAPVAVSTTSLATAENVKGADGRPYAFVRVAEGETPGLEGGNYLVDRATGLATARRVDGIGGKTFPAPQANLMAVLINGLLDRKLPWDLILIGVAIALFIELLSGHSLTFAVGVYLPLSTTMPIFLGGLVRMLADRRYKRVPDDPAETEGTLWSSGLIAGGALIGVLVALLHFDVFHLPFDENLELPLNLAIGPKFWPALFGPGWIGDVVPLVAFAALGALLYRGARDPKPSVES
ncbi:MAG: oligopeptide transporter, OPT family [Thermoanaerobaculia bacterium]